MNKFPSLYSQLKEFEEFHSHLQFRFKIWQSARENYFDSNFHFLIVNFFLVNLHKKCTTFILKKVKSPLKVFKMLPWDPIQRFLRLFQISINFQNWELCEKENVKTLYYTTATAEEIFEFWTINQSINTLSNSKMNSNILF